MQSTHPQTQTGPPREPRKAESTFAAELFKREQAARDKVAAARENKLKAADKEGRSQQKAMENEESWQVKDGDLVCKGPRCHLFYVGEEAPWKNFHFKAEVMTLPGSNSGIYFHTRFRWRSRYRITS